MEQHQNIESEQFIIKDRIKNDLELSATDHKDFPTNVDILSKGVSDIIAFQREFNDLDENINAFDDILLGISPERGCIAGTILPGLPNKRMQKVITFLEKRGYLVTDLTELYQSRWPKRGLFRRIRDNLFYEKPHIYSIINLHAAQRIVQQDRQRGSNIFPVNIDVANLHELRAWLRDHPEEWTGGENVHFDREGYNVFTVFESGERAGLLSGYPIHSVLEFRRYHEASKHFGDEASKLGINPDRIESVIDFRSLDRNGIYQELLQNPNLTSELREELSFIMRFFLGGDFVATSQEDFQWRRNLFALKEKVYALFADKISRPESM